MLVPVGGQETQGQKVLALTRKLAKEEVALELGEEDKGMPCMEYCSVKGVEARNCRALWTTGKPEDLFSVVSAGLRV